MKDGSYADGTALGSKSKSVQRSAASSPLRMTRAQLASQEIQDGS